MGSCEPHSTPALCNPHSYISANSEELQTSSREKTGSQNGAIRYSLQKTAATSHCLITTKGLTLVPLFTPPHGLISLTTEIRTLLGLSVQKPHCQLPKTDPRVLTYTSISRQNETFPTIPKRTNQEANDKLWDIHALGEGLMKKMLTKQVWLPQKNILHCGLEDS